MALPQTVEDFLPSGIPGEIASHYPVAARSVQVVGADAQNIFGHAFTFSSQAKLQVKPGGSGVFAGILANPKAHANEIGTVSKNTVGDLVFGGEIFVFLAADNAAIGSDLYFIPATGQLTTDADDGEETPTNYTKIEGARVERLISSDSSGAKQSLAIVRLVG